MMSDFRGGGGSKKTRLYKVKIGLRGGGGSKMTQKNRTSFMNDPLAITLYFGKLIKQLKFSKNDSSLSLVRHEQWFMG